MIRAVVVATALLVAPATLSAADWGTVPGPLAGPPAIHGPTNRGCIAGATALPVDGPGYQVIRAQRKRHYGHPSLVAVLQDLARQVAAEGLAPLLVADMAQPRGGPMLSDHASHQTGLDADIWFRPGPIPEAERSRPLATDMVTPDGKATDPARFGRRERRLLELAARHPAIDRILVNPAIKQDLCATVTGERRWLARVRPWWGHNRHVHIRLRCPPGDAGCVDARPPPPGEGCGPDLSWWFSADALNALRERLERAKIPSKPPPLPEACAAILAAPPAKRR